MFLVAQCISHNFVLRFLSSGRLILYTKQSYLFSCLKYLSIGDDQGRLPVTYSHLKIIELYEVSFEDMKEILVVLHLITNSPNLKELQISVSYCDLVQALFCSSFSFCFVFFIYS